jgi:hypothetical protein
LKAPIYSSRIEGKDQVAKMETIEILLQNTEQHEIMAESGITAEKLDATIRAKLEATHVELVDTSGKLSEARSFL